MIQNQMLNYILSTKDSSIITLNGLTAEYFSDYASEYNFIKSHLNKYNTIPDLETFLNVFPDFKITTVGEPVDYLLSELMRDKNKRFLAENYRAARGLIIDGKVEEAMAILKKASEESTEFISLNAIDLMHDKSRFDSYVDKIDNFDKYFITTGFKELDTIFGGWDTNEDVATIVARNGVGKSWILNKCAAAAALNGKRVGLYSGEMSEDAVGYRIDTLVGHISNGALVHGGSSVKNEYKKFLDKLSSECKGNLFVLTPKQIRGRATVSALRAFVEKYNLDILFIDQHSLLEDERGGKTDVAAASNISTDIKMLQTTKRIPIVCVAQQNREKVEGGFSTTQIARADKIAQDSSIIIFLERKDDLMRLHVEKSRQSGAGQILSYRIDLNRGIFDYIPGERDALATMADQDETENMYDSNNLKYSDEDVF